MELKHHEDLQELVDHCLGQTVKTVDVLEEDAYIFNEADDIATIMEVCLKAGAEAGKSAMSPHYLKAEGTIFLYTDRAPNLIRSDLEALG